MSEAFKTDDREKARPKIVFYDPWQRQFISHNKQNEFRKTIEASGTTEG